MLALNVPSSICFLDQCGCIVMPAKLMSLPFCSAVSVYTQSQGMFHSAMLVCIKVPRDVVAF